MVEAEDVRVQGEPAERIRPGPVGGVAGDGVAEPGEMDADLVAAPRFEPDLEQRVVRPRAQHPPARDRRPPVPRTAGFPHPARSVVEKPAPDRARGTGE